MTMSGFRVAPRQGHLERLKRIYGYLAKMRQARLRIRTDKPDWSDVPEPEYDWAHTIYGDVKEQIPDDAFRDCTSVYFQFLTLSCIPIYTGTHFFTAACRFRPKHNILQNGFSNLLGFAPHRATATPMCKIL